MKILLILPHGPIHRAGSGTYRKSLRYAPLTLTALAALVPPDLGAEIVLLDEGAAPWDLADHQDADLVGVSSMTGTAPRAYAIADAFRAMGKPVIMGGVHASMLPQEAKAHADCVITGYAEQTFPQALRDWVAGQLQPFYHQPPGYQLDGLPVPHRHRLDRKQYVTVNTLEATRGCHNPCAFCAIANLTGHRFFTRPVAEVIAEAEQLQGRELCFMDPNMIGNPEHARQLFRELAPLKKIWAGCTTIDLADDDELLGLAAKSGCRGLLIGFESVNQETLKGVMKGRNQVNRYVEALKKFHAHGIAVQACFFFGSDTDDRDIFDRTVEFVYQANVDLPQFSLFTPFPGTPTYRDLHAQGRIVETNWALFDCEHVVFQPRNMSRSELQQGLIHAWRESYRLGSIAKRLGSARCLLPLTLPANLGYRFFARHLDAYDPARMAQETVLCDSRPPVAVGV